MENKNPYNLTLSDICVVGCFDVLSLRKVSAIKRSLAEYAMNGDVHIAVLGDLLAFDLGESIPLQDEERRAKFVCLKTQIKPTLVTDDIALKRYIQEKQPYCRFIVLSSESREIKESLKKLFDIYSCVFSFVDAFHSDNKRYMNYISKHGNNSRKTAPAQ